MAEEYTRHHYVPQWYQKRFMLPNESHLFCLNLKPDVFTDPRGVSHIDRPVKRQGSRLCFVQDDLYTTKVQGMETKDIEKHFFGSIDTKGKDAVEYFNDFSYPLKAWGDSLGDIMRYMSTQKLRTPKGLDFLSEKIGSSNKDRVLRSMLRLQGLHCAIWTESVWLIADASQSETKFIISDHPVTVYNRECGPRSQWCRGSSDPAIWLEGTHTIFPLSIDKVLILTNLSWVRNPYQSATKERPNPNPFRGAIFKFTEVQVERKLSEQEVREINFIIKSRACRYVAAAREEWLYPEKHVSKSDWNRYGHGYLLMPDPRAVHWGGTIMWGGGPGGSGAMDEYGRLPGDPDFEAGPTKGKEYQTLPWFQGEFAKLFGPYRRGRSMQAMSIDNEKDSDDFHKYHLGLQKKRFKDRKKPPVT